MSDLQQIEMFPTVGVDPGRGQDRITALYFPQFQLYDRLRCGQEHGAPVLVA